MAMHPRLLASIFLLVALSIPPGPARSAELPAADSGTALPFPDLWRDIERHSPAQRSAELQVRTAQATETRVSRYRLPQVYVESRLYNTNDPALTFMSRLGQRQVEAEDLTTSSLNEPGTNSFGRATLGVTLPMYEGGQGAAETASARDLIAAQESQLAGTRNQQFADAFADYGSMLAFRDASTRLTGLSAQVDETLQHYEVGSATNPVGYSGLLGLKTLANRFKILSNDLTTQEQAAKAALSTQADLDPSQWKPDPLSVDAFTQRHAPAAAGSGPQSSYQADSLKSLASSANHHIEMERSALRPKAGLFVESNVATGIRGTGTSYVAGAYLSWNLFSPKSYGAPEEARLKSYALQEQANAVVQQDRIATAESVRTLASLRETVALLKANDALLDEQVRTSKRLFASGTISALQLAETYARRLDAIQAVLQSDLAQLQAYRALIVHRAELPHVQ